jgi:8-amino-7-oxononanoate synthase
MNENTLPDQIDSRKTGLSDFVDFAHPDLFHKAHAFAQFLRDGRARGYDTYVHRVSKYTGGCAVVDSEDRTSQQQVVMMCSADYLGLAQHPQVLAAAQKAINQYGASVCSVPLIAGATALHGELEARLARFLGTEACVLFPTGHAANIGLIQALCTPKDMVILDKLVHWSIFDGVRLSGARWRTFRHSNTEHLVRVLKTVRSKHENNGILVVVEGAYGIDGDIAPLRDLLAVCNRFGARLMVDEAHATGVVGKTGRGSLESHEITDSSLIIMGSLSKSLGSFGGFIAAPAEIADYLRYYARTIAFSVGLPASCVGAAMAGLDILQDHSTSLAKLRANIGFFQSGLEHLGVANAKKSGSAIFSVPVGNEGSLRDMAREMFRRGVYAEALGFPAVLHGQERIRFRVSASHTQENLSQVLQILTEVRDKFSPVKE